MADINGIIQDKNGNNCYPKTFDYNVYNSNNESLDNTLDSMAFDINHMAMANASNLTSDNVTDWNNALHTEQVKVVYDKNSNDSSINWGYTSGLSSGTNVTSKDFSAYKRLICVVDLNWRGGTFELDLTSITDAGYYYGALFASIMFDSTAQIHYCQCEVGSAKTNFKVDWCGIKATGTSSYTYAIGKITKIYGVY